MTTIKEGDIVKLLNVGNATIHDYRGQTVFVAGENYLVDRVLPNGNIGIVSAHHECYVHSNQVVTTGTSVKVTKHWYKFW